MLTLARHWLRHNQFTDLAQPAIDDISQRFGVTVLGVNIVGLDHMIVVAVSQAGANFQLSAQVGSRFPALISATGRCLAAFGGYPEQELAARFEELRWDEPPSFGEWQAQVEEIIIGVRRRSKVGKLLFGSTAQYVILNAPCPVVSVK